MRNQYKLLSEKYQLIQEDDKEDILSGLEVLSHRRSFPIYMIEQAFGDHYYEMSDPIEMTSEKIRNYLYEFPEYDKKGEDWPDYDTCIERIYGGNIVMLYSEVDEVIYWLGLDKAELKAAATEYENEHFNVG